MKAAIIVQARAGSARLPGKVLAPFCGTTMLGFLLNRLHQTRGIYQLVLATTEGAEDDRVCQVGAQHGAVVVRGGAEDVLGRYAKAAQTVNCDTIIRVCADNPLTDPEIIEKSIAALARSGADHVSCFERHTYPYGVGCSVFTRRALDYAAANAHTPYDREHVEPFMLRGRKIRTLHLQAPQHLSRPEIHVSVDLPFELVKVSNIAASLLSSKGEGFRTADLIKFLDDVRVVAFANGSVGLACIKHLRAIGEKLVGLVVHPATRSSRQADIIAESGLEGADVFKMQTLDDDRVSAWLQERQPDIITSFWASYLFKERDLALPPRGITNLHNSLLPWCRGSQANIWTILDGVPGGVTFHYVSKKIDRGPIIVQKPIETFAWDSAKTLQLRLERALVRLFKKTWPSVRVGPVRTVSQKGDGSFHKQIESDALRRIDLDRTYSGRELINRLRAFSYPPYEGCFFVDEIGNQVDLVLSLRRK